MGFRWWKSRNWKSDRKLAAAVATAEDVVDHALPDVLQGTSLLLTGPALVDELEFDTINAHALDLAKGNGGDGLRVRGDDANTRAGDGAVDLLGCVLSDGIVRQQGDTDVK